MALILNDEKPEDNAGWMLANDHASTTLISLVYDPTDRHMLVAALCSFTSMEIYTALKAQLEKNSATAYSMRAIPDKGSPITLSGAGRGYVTDKQPFDQFRARAFGAAFVNKKAGDPRLNPGTAFYVLPFGDDKPEDLFIERLIAATPLPLLREWKEYLLSAGRARKLVSELPVIGLPGVFNTPLKVSVLGWDKVVSDGLQHGLIQFAA